MVVRPARVRGAAALPSAVRLRRRLHVRGSRGGLRRRPGHAPVAARQEPDPAARRGRKPALLDAGNDSRAGGRSTCERRRRTWRSGAATPSTTWRSRARRTSQRMSRESMRHDLVIHERDNMRAALAWAAETGDQTLGLELVVALENYWATASPEEGLEWAVTLLAGADQADGVDPGLVARALRVQGGMQNVVGQVDASDASWEQALAIARRLGDDRAVAILLHRFSSTAIRRGDPTSRSRASPRRASKATVAPATFPKGEAQALTSLAWVGAAGGRPRGGARAVARSSGQGCGRPLSLVGGRHARQHRSRVASARQARRRPDEHTRGALDLERDARSSRGRLRAQAAHG